MIDFKEHGFIFERMRGGGGAEAGKYDFLDLDVVKAKSIAMAIVATHNKNFKELYPKFDYTFLDIKRKLESATGAKRKEMPVIAFNQVDEFKQDLLKNKVRAFYKYQKIGELKPIQSQIYFDKLITAEIKYGGIRNNPDNTLVVSKDGYIIDGHHRWATGALAEPDTKVKTLVVDMPTEELVQYALDWGHKKGNVPNE